MMTKEEYHQKRSELIKNHHQNYLKSKDKVSHIQSLIAVKNDLNEKIELAVESIDKGLKELKGDIDFRSKIKKRKKFTTPEAFKINSNLDSYYRFSVYFGIRQSEKANAGIIDAVSEMLSERELRRVAKLLNKLDTVAERVLRRDVIEYFIDHMEKHGFPNEWKFKSNSIVTEINPIHWLKGEQSLRLFIEELKSAGLVEERKTEDIIQEHFKQSDQTPNPFKWTNTNRLLIYLFKRLSESGLVDTMDKQFKLITEHFLDKKGQPFKRNSLKQDSYNLKYNSDPKGSNIIENIISKLTD